MGGLATIYNTGPEIIHAGDIVMWGLPTTKASGNGGPPRFAYKIAGIPREKMLFATLKYKESDVAVTKENKDEIRRECARNDGACNPAQCETVLTKILQNKYDRRRRVIGRALSSAKPAKPFDLQLGHYMS
jgi:hypothetical protein